MTGTGDNLKYIVHEAFLYCVAIFLKYERFDVVEYMVKQRYYIAIDEEHGRDAVRSFGVFQNNLVSLNRRSTRLRLNRLSLHADIIKERSANAVVTFNQLMQADFLLYITDSIYALLENRRNEWWPETLVFKTFPGGSFEIFIRSESSSYFDKIRSILGIKSKTDLAGLIKAWGNGQTHIPKWDFDCINPTELMNYKNLAIRP